MLDQICEAQKKE